LGAQVTIGRLKQRTLAYVNVRRGLNADIDMKHAAIGERDLDRIIAFERRVADASDACDRARFDESLDHIR
jgi:hypothetical protein